jgi:TonB family protein
MAATTVPGVTDLLKNLGSQSGTMPGAAELGVDIAIGRDGEPWGVTSVDDPVAVIEQPEVRYPAALAHAGIPGRVELEYVVDTLGRAEPRSVRALVSTRPEFEAAAREAVLASRYRPARLRGRLVRQLVRQTLSFRAVP